MKTTLKTLHNKLQNTRMLHILITSYGDAEYDILFHKKDFCKACEVYEKAAHIWYKNYDKLYLKYDDFTYFLDAQLEKHNIDFIYIGCEKAVSL